MNSLEHYYGRLFTSEQLTDALKKQAKALPAMIDHKTHAECCRCGSKVFSNYQLQTGALYCRECLVFGRIQISSPCIISHKSHFQKKMFWFGRVN